jgi:hypothetical protein
MNNLGEEAARLAVESFADVVVSEALEDNNGHRK